MEATNEAVRLGELLEPTVLKLVGWYPLLDPIFGEGNRSSLVLPNGLSFALDSWLTACEQFAFEYQANPILVFCSHLLIFSERNPELASITEPYIAFLAAPLTYSLSEDEPLAPELESWMDLFRGKAGCLLESLRRLRLFAGSEELSLVDAVSAAIAVGQQFRWLWNLPFSFGLQYGSTVTAAARKARKKKSEESKAIALQLWAEQRRDCPSEPKRNAYQIVAKKVSDRLGCEISPDTIRRYVTAHDASCAK